LISEEQALAFSQQWIESWNSHDLDRILSHYSEDFEMTSPVIHLLADQPTGTLKGKDRVGGYWKEALAHFPDVEFEMISVLIGVDSITLNYRGPSGLLVTEVLFFGQDGRVVKGVVHYAGE
jgi:hypothetical protein